MHDVTSAGSATPRLLTVDFQQSGPACAQDMMGCSTSSQTSAVDSTRPSPKESNGASTTGDSESFICAMVEKMETHFTQLDEVETRNNNAMLLTVCNFLFPNTF